MPSRGVVTAMPGLLLSDQYAVKANNIRLWRGEVQNRPGLEYFPAPKQLLANCPIGGSGFTTFGGSFFSVIATEDKHYRYDEASDLWVDITAAANAPSATTSEPWSFASALDYLCSSNGFDKVYKWAGTGLHVQVAASSPARYLAAFANRLFLAHVTDSSIIHNNRVRWCADNDLDTWAPGSDPTAGYMDVLDTPGEITGLVSYGGYLYVFKRNSISRISETGLIAPSFAQQVMPYGVGCLEGRTIVEIAGRLLFLGAEDIYSWAPGTAPTPIGTQIRDEIFQTLNRGRIRQAFAYHHELFNEYHLVIPIGVTTDITQSGAWGAIVYVFNYIDQSWSKFFLDNSTCHVPLYSGETLDEFIDNEPTGSIDWTIQDWTWAIDGGIIGAKVSRPAIGRIQTLSTQQGFIAKFQDGDDRDYATQGFSCEFETADTQLTPPPSPPRDHTLNFVTLVVRDRGPANYILAASMDSGATWKTLGVKSVPGVDDNRLTYLRFDGNRLTGPTVRIAFGGFGGLSFGAKFGLQRIIYETQERGTMVR